MRSRKEHDALGGVYAYLEEERGEPGSREEAIRDIAENEVALEYDEQGYSRSRRQDSWAEDMQAEVEALQETYPVEEHAYDFAFEPPRKRPTFWVIYTEKRPDGSWSGHIQRYTSTTRGEDDETTFHEQFEQGHAANERALLNDLIDQAQRSARTRRNPGRKNPREYPRYVSSHGGRETIWHYLGRDILVYPDPDPETPGTWVAEWSDPDCGCYFDGKTEQEALTMARDGIDEADAALAVALKTLKKKNPRKAKKAKTSALFRRLMRI